MTARVYISPASDAHAELRRLARELTLTGAAPGDDDAALLLEYQHERLQIRRAARRERPWFVDFVSARSRYRRRFGGGVRQTLARAVGLKANHRPDVLDATAGWGRDAFVLASLGCRVDMVERHPVVAALLADGLRRAALEPEVAAIVGRMRLHAGDACDYLGELPADATPDVVYLDPMYPQQSRESAAVKKDASLLRDLVGDAPTEPRLLEAALARARERAVVKRPKGAPRLDERSPDAVISSANTRYDVYSTRSRSSR